MKYIIPEPCNASLQEMQNTEKGKFCFLCNKEVIDFRNWNKDAIEKYLDAHPSCGIFRKEQFFPEIKPVAKSSILSSSIRLFGALAMFFGLASCNEKVEPNKHTSNAQEPNIKEELKEENYAPMMGKPCLPKFEKRDKSIKGLIKPIKKEEEKTKVLLQYSIDEEMFLFGETRALPEFPGGENALIKFITDNIQYPENEIFLKRECKVNVEFIIDIDGKICEAKILNKGISENFEKEALRILEIMPNWNNPLKTPIAFTLPITFKLED